MAKMLLAYKLEINSVSLRDKTLHIKEPGDGYKTIVRLTVTWTILYTKVKYT